MSTATEAAAATITTDFFRKNVFLPNLKSRTHVFAWKCANHRDRSRYTHRDCTIKKSTDKLNTKLWQFRIRQDIFILKIAYLGQLMLMQANFIWFKACNFIHWTMLSIVYTDVTLSVKKMEGQKKRKRQKILGHVAGHGRVPDKIWLWFRMTSPFIVLYSVLPIDFFTTKYFVLMNP